MKFTVSKKVEVVEEDEIEYGEAEDLEAHYVSLRIGNLCVSYVL
jgi:hypothetical protein